MARSEKNQVSQSSILRGQQGGQLLVLNGIISSLIHGREEMGNWAEITYNPISPNLKLFFGPTLKNQEFGEAQFIIQRLKIYKIL